MRFGASVTKSYFVAYQKQNPFFLLFSISVSDMDVDWSLGLVLVFIGPLDPPTLLIC